MQLIKYKTIINTRPQFSCSRSIKKTHYKINQLVVIVQQKTNTYCLLVIIFFEFSTSMNSQSIPLIRRFSPIRGDISKDVIPVTSVTCNKQTKSIGVFRFSTFLLWNYSTFDDHKWCSWHKVNLVLSRPPSCNQACLHHHMSSYSFCFVTNNLSWMKKLWFIESGWVLEQKT